MTTKTNNTRRINWAIIISIIGIILTGYYNLNPIESKLKYNVLANTNVLDLKANVAKLSVSYDSIDLIKSKQSISIVIVEIRNDGNKDIRLDDYDKTADFGMEVSNGIILSKPTINSSSDNNYFKDIIKNFDENKIKFKFKLLDKDQFFTLKFLVLHSRETTPTISSLGKISGLKKIEITNTVESNAEFVDLKEKYRNLVYIFGSILILGMFLYIIQSQKAKIREITLNKEELLTEKLIQLSLEEMVELNVGELVYHEKFGKGEVISIEKNKDFKDNYKGTFKFDVGGQKKLLLKFSSLYRFEQ